MMRIKSAHFLHGLQAAAAHGPHPLEPVGAILVPLDNDFVWADKVAVRYHEFKSTFVAALRDSGLPTIGPPPHEEVLDLVTTDRTVTVYVEPAGRDMGAPFHISGEISWRWDALQAARTATTEEDMLTELFGREDARGQETVHARLRVDIELHASLEYGKWIPMPSRAAWSEWRREAVGRLQTIERLVDDDDMLDLSDEGLAQRDVCASESSASRMARGDGSSHLMSVHADESDRSDRCRGASACAYR